MGLAQRGIEASGIPTVSLTNMPFVTEKTGVPRAVAVEFPFGMIWGLPGDLEMHERILGHMLEAVETMTGPGAIVELPYEWPEELRRKRDWFPETTPWLSSQEGINQMIEFLQHGNPLE